MTLRAVVVTKIERQVGTAHLLQNGVNLLVGTLAVVGPLMGPFNNYDWPNPRGATPSTDLRTHLEVRKQYYVDKFFGLAGNPTFDWPNPRGNGPSVALRTHLNGPPQTYGILPSPFRQSDWPVPKGYHFSVLFRSQIVTPRLVNTWAVVTDGNTPGWGAVTDGNTPGWGAVTDGNTPGWTARTTGTPNAPNIT